MISEKIIEATCRNWENIVEECIRVLSKLDYYPKLSVVDDIPSQLHYAIMPKNKEFRLARFKKGIFGRDAFNESYCQCGYYDSCWVFWDATRNRQIQAVLCETEFLRDYYCRPFSADINLFSKLYGDRKNWLYGCAIETLILRRIAYAMARVGQIFCEETENPCTPDIGDVNDYIYGEPGLLAASEADRIYDGCCKVVESVQSICGFDLSLIDEHSSWRKDSEMVRYKSNGIKNQWVLKGSVIS